MLRKLLQKELLREIAELEKVKGNLTVNPKVTLAFSKSGFYYYVKDDRGKPGRRRYIRRSDVGTLRQITGIRYLEVKSKLLSHNIGVLRDALQNALDCDDSAIINALPKTYASAIELVRAASSDNVFQSENTMRREDLSMTTSTGVKVRTKSELALYETLIGYGLKVFYEKKLKLVRRVVAKDGTVEEKIVYAYPDFTIVLPDGSEIYWDLCGMFDDSAYRSRQYEKFCAYYDNGIYMPKNLIVTMESPDKPLDIQAIRRIIESRILPML